MTGSARFAGPRRISSRSSSPLCGDWLESLYWRYNRREFAEKDPVGFLHRYPDVRDREIVGLLASCLAYGRVGQILRSVEAVLSRLMPAPYEFVISSTQAEMESAFRGFRHRFSDGHEVGGILCRTKCVIERYGSLERCFLNGWSSAEADAAEGLRAFVEELGGGKCGSLVPLPERGSACKRLNLFLRWMVRHDEVDPGGWGGVPASALVVPMDVHMHRLAVDLGLTNKKQADMRSARELTEAFRAVSGADPVRYDFALTRRPIHGGPPIQVN